MRLYKISYNERALIIKFQLTLKYLLELNKFLKFFKL